MIPKTIHYIWLSNDPLNDMAKFCINFWKENAPDYIVKKWTIGDFNVNDFPTYVQEAIHAKKWAFASDFLRLYILYKEGGWYFDSDVLMLKPLKNYKNDKFVSNIEYYENLFEEDKEHVNSLGDADQDMVKGIGIQAAIMGSEKGHIFLKKCMEYYIDKHFSMPNGGMLAPHIYALVAREFGFKYQNKEQFLKDGIHLLGAEIFAPSFYYKTKKARLIHLCNGSWREDPTGFFKNQYSLIKQAFARKTLISIFGIKILTLQMTNNKKIYHFLGIKITLKI